MVHFFLTHGVEYNNGITDAECFTTFLIFKYQKQLYNEKACLSVQFSYINTNTVRMHSYCHATWKITNNLNL